MVHLRSESVALTGVQLQGTSNIVGLEERFAELLSEVARQVTARQASEVCCEDLTLEQFQTLRAIHASEPASGSASKHAPAGSATISGLAAELRVDLSTMSRNITLLERNGYLAKGRSPEDARVVRVHLTAEGQRALQTLRCGEREVLGDVFERLPAVARPKVLDLLEALSACLASTGDGGVDCCPPATTTIRRRGA
jgi:DNA-binding MarR family transcriptional regulator